MSAIHHRLTRGLSLVIMFGAVVSTEVRANAQPADSHPAICTVNDASGLRGAADDTRLWPGGIVPYTFDAGVAANEQQLFNDVLTKLEGICNVQFVTRTTETDYIVVQWSGSSGSNSAALGHRGGAQNINIWNWDVERIVIHEVMHALGLYHEQSRVDRDDYLRVNYENITDTGKGNYALQPGAFVDGPYDLASVMHYPDTNFNANGKRTMSVEPPYAAEWQNVIGRTFDPSCGDRWALTTLYGGTPPPRVFELTTPASGSLVGLGWVPSFTWTLSDLADSYQILVDDDPDFSSPAINETVTTNGYTAVGSLPPHTLFYWTVIATNGIGETEPFPMSRAAFYTGAAVPEVIYVDDDGAPGNLGLSWVDARPDLFKATELARWLPGKVSKINVGQGTYTPDGGTGDRLRTFELADGVTLIGGFAGTGAPNPNARAPGVFLSILSGDLNGDDQPGFVNVAENAYHVVTGSFVTDAVLDGFVIEGGNANRADRSFRTPDVDQGGGGLVLDGSRVSVRSCLIRDNSAEVQGGGCLVYDDRGSTVERCTFVGNAGLAGARTYGGGLAIARGGDVLVTGCTFQANEAANGGALYIVSAGSPMVIDTLCVVNQATKINASTGFGGAVATQNQATPRVLNSTFIANNADSGGGGIAALSGAIADVRNSVLWSNISSNGPQLLLGVGDPALTISYSNYEGGAAGVGILSGTFTDGAGNIDMMPQFVNAMNGDFRLDPSSPCIDAGDTTALPLEVAKDLDGGARIVDDPATVDSGVGDLDGRVVDMGAFEFLSDDCNDNTIADAAEIAADSSTDCNGDGVLDECQVIGLMPGTALHFDGSDFVEVADSPELQFLDGEPITIEAWIRVDQLEAPPGDTSSRSMIVTKNYWGRENYFFQVEPGGELRFGYRNASNTAAYNYTTTAPEVSTDGNWYHVAVGHVFGQANIDVYVNGQTVAGAWDTTPTEGPIDSASTELLIGTESKNPAYHRYFVGAIDDVRIWRADRSQAVIQQDMTRRLTGGESDLVAYWDFEEGSGNTVADLAGGHDGLRLSPRWVPRAGCTAGPADFNADGYVDVYDYPFLADCLAGPEVSTPPIGCTQAHFDLCDLQGDGDVDLRDFASFIQNLGP